MRINCKIMKIHIYLVVIFSILVSNCASNKEYPREKIEYLSDSNNIVLLRATAYGKNSEEALSNAELSAIKTLLFRGIPNSNKVQSILIGVNEQEIQNQHSGYFSELFGNKRYRSFILSSSPVTQYNKDVTGAKSITTDIKLNVNALRRDLEQNGVIRKFGL